jgi:hypothetical protein
MNCCGNIPESESHGTAPQVARRGAALAAWIVPSILLAFFPKCPACLAAYVAMATGVGLSVSTAGYLRTALFLACVASLATLAGVRLYRGILALPRTAP